MQILGCLFMILFVGLFVLVSFGLSIINAVLRLFGFNRPSTTFRDERQSAPASEDQPKKVFEDNEGEYIDFEEV